MKKTVISIVCIMLIILALVIGKYFNNSIRVVISFTSKIILEKLKKKEVEVYNLSDTLYMLKNSGFKEVIVQPLYMMDGSENEKIRKEGLLYKESFKILKINKNLFGSRELINMDAIYETAKIINKSYLKNESILIAGHGSKINSNDIYDIIRTEACKEGNKKVYMATLEGENTLKTAIEEMKIDKVSNIRIIPIFLIKGRHVIRDICKGDDSWKKYLEDQCFQVEYSLKSLLQYEEIRKIYIKMIDFSEILQKD